jgi:hopanoid biosynthesis associated protein HpnK
MVGAPAAADAVSRARRLPALKVGLHLTVVDDRPVLSPAEIPALAGGDGRLPSNQVAAGFRFYFSRRTRADLGREIRAQFEAFARTGLTLDHVNGHRHMHVHPTVFGLMLAVGREFGLKAVRLPREPVLFSWPGILGQLAWLLLVTPWIALMGRRLARAGIAHNDHVFGIVASGRMTGPTLLAYLARLPEGVSEIYCHPGAGGTDRDAELAALTAPEIAAALPRLGIVLTTFGALQAGLARP